MFNLNIETGDVLGEVSMIPTQTRSLFISAGHDMKDRGAFGNGYFEADIVLEFRDLLKNYIISKRPTFDLNTDGELGVNLPLTIAAYKASKYDLSIEFHCNAFVNTEVSGVEALGGSHHSGIGYHLCDVTSNTLGIRNRGYKPENSGQHSRLAFVSDGGGIIHELFFITNRKDIQKYYDNKIELVENMGDLLIDYCCEKP